MTSTAKAPRLARILDIVHEQLGEPELRVGPTSLARETQGWNSIATVNILFAVEEALGVEFTSAQMERVDGVPALMDVVQQALALEAAQP